MKRILILAIFCSMTAYSAMAQSQSEKKIAIVERYWKAYIETDLNTIAETVDKDYKCYIFNKFECGYDGLVNMIKEKKGSGESMDTYEWIVEGNKVAHTWTAEFRGTYEGMSYYFIKNGKIIEEWSCYKRVENQ